MVAQGSGKRVDLQYTRVGGQARRWPVMCYPDSCFLTAALTDLSHQIRSVSPLLRFVAEHFARACHQIQQGIVEMQE
jgi:hypothetical protein